MMDRLQAYKHFQRALRNRMKVRERTVGMEALLVALEALEELLGGERHEDRPTEREMAETARMREELEKKPRYQEA